LPLTQASLQAGPHVIVTQAKVNSSAWGCPFEVQLAQDDHSGVNSYAQYQRDHPYWAYTAPSRPMHADRPWNETLPSRIGSSGSLVVGRTAASLHLYAWSLWSGPLYTDSWEVAFKPPFWLVFLFGCRGPRSPRLSPKPTPPRLLLHVSLTRLLPNQLNPPRGPLLRGSHVYFGQQSTVETRTVHIYSNQIWVFIYHSILSPILFNSRDFLDITLQKYTPNKTMEDFLVFFVSFIWNWIN